VRLRHALGADARKAPDSAGHRRTEQNQPFTLFVQVRGLVLCVRKGCPRQDSNLRSRLRRLRKSYKDDQQLEFEARCSLLSVIMSDAALRVFRSSLSRWSVSILGASVLGSQSWHACFSFCQSIAAKVTCSGCCCAGPVGSLVRSEVACPVVLPAIPARCEGSLGWQLRSEWKITPGSGRRAGW
jgi:hypothetical protein